VKTELFAVIVILYFSLLFFGSVAFIVFLIWGNLVGSLILSGLMAFGCMVVLWRYNE